ncbi:hypothetical protein RJ640_001600 [Escallonia rubra]|uniref:Uncharacterized protein n=1 Tax=Escallonia rubra TaxID=112253 RepID=A0AA88S0L6_9ASTE|nr:hypothetical protein RJ640_001600 [Escallonia rubra]
MEEGSATTRPPLLKNENYSYWKNRRRNFLRQDTQVWYVVENGPIIPMKDGPDGSKIPKGILEMDNHEAQLFSMDDKVKNIISCGLDINEYNRVSACETAREMWRLLEVTHEGTNQVKETKINMLVQQYEAFKMKEHESINEITGHIKKYCPQLKNKSASNNGRDIKEKKFKPRKALLTWDDSDKSDKETSEDEEVAQLCFMAKDDHSDKVISENFDYKKLELAFLELSENHERLKDKNADLKRKALSLISIIEEMEGEKEDLDEKVEL